MVFGIKKLSISRGHPETLNRILEVNGGTNANGAEEIELSDAWRELKYMQLHYAKLIVMSYSSTPVHGGASGISNQGRSCE